MAVSGRGDIRPGRKIRPISDRFPFFQRRNRRISAARAYSLARRFGHHDHISPAGGIARIRRRAYTFGRREWRRPTQSVRFATGKPRGDEARAFSSPGSGTGWFIRWKGGDDDEIPERETMTVFAAANATAVRGSPDHPCGRGVRCRVFTRLGGQRAVAARVKAVIAGSFERIHAGKPYRHGNPAAAVHGRWNRLRPWPGRRRGIPHDRISRLEPAAPWKSRRTAPRSPDSLFR